MRKTTNFYQAQQDTISIKTQADSLHNSVLVQPDTLNKSVELSSIDSVFMRLERRNQEIQEKHARTVIQRKPAIDTAKLREFDPDTVDMFKYDSASRTEFIFRNNQFYKYDIIQHKASDVFVQQDSSNAVVIVKPDVTNTMSNQQQRSIHYADWLLPVFLVQFVILAAARLFYAKYFVPVFEAAYNYQLSIKLFRDKNAILQRISFAMNTVFVLSLALFSYLLLSYYDVYRFGFSDIQVYLVLVVAITLMYVIKTISSKILGYLFVYRELFAEYVHHVFIYKKSIGVYLIPISLLLAYAPDGFNHIYMISGIVIVVLLYLLRTLRTIKIFISSSVSFFYMILYLCSLEILPILILVKFLKGLI